MTIYRFAAALLIVLGVFSLVYGGSTPANVANPTSAGSFRQPVDNTKRADIPAWAGLGGILIGGFLLFFRRLPD